jgi:hypothetical protein
LGEEAHVLSEQLLLSDSIARKGNQKIITLNITVKEQVLKCPYQEAFITGTLQVTWSKMQPLWFSWCECHVYTTEEVESPSSAACYLTSTLSDCSSNHTHTVLKLP